VQLTNERQSADDEHGLATRVAKLLGLDWQQHPALPTLLPMQCATGFGSGTESALQCNEAVGVARGQQAATGAPLTTQQRITGMPNTPSAVAPPSALNVAPATNLKDALKQGLKGLLAK
jgi:hypothetical protein